MNYSGQAPNGPFIVADQARFLRQNAGTRLIGAPDRILDKSAVSLANYRHTDAKQENRINLLHKGFSILTVNRNQTKKNHRD